MSLASGMPMEVAGEALAVAKKSDTEPLSDCVRGALQNYFAHLNGHTATDLYQLVMCEVERPLFACVMVETRPGRRASWESAAAPCARNWHSTKLTDQTG